MKYSAPFLLVVIFLSAGAGLLFITLFSYSGALENTFVYDSRPYLIGNEYITNLSLKNILWMLGSTTMVNWHPFAWFSYAVDYHIYGGLKPEGFHLTNNILHGINSILVFFVILVLLGLNKVQTNVGPPILIESRALIAALVAAFIFAVHPQHVESVVWVAERKDLLCLFFIMLTFLAYVFYVHGRNHKKFIWYFLAFFFYLLAIMSKPMAVTMPVILLLMDIYPLRRMHMTASSHDSALIAPFSKLLIEKSPFILLSGFSVAMTLFAQRSAMPGLIDIPLSIRILNAFDSIFLYLHKALVPVNYVLSYPHLHHKLDGITAQTWLSVCAFFLVSLLVMRAWRSKQYVWAVSWAYYLVTLSPVIGIIQVGLQGAADRYAYMTTLPLYFLLGAGLFRLLCKKSRLYDWSIVLGSLIIVVLLIGITRDQVKVWKNPVTLWEHAVSVYPDYGYAYGNLGHAYYMAGEFDLATKYFSHANSRGRLFINYLLPAAISHIETGSYEDALSLHIVMTINAEKHPSYEINVSCAQYNIGWLMAKLGAYQDAKDMFSKVLQDPMLGEDAKNWVDYLSSREQTQDDRMAVDGMPGYCKDVSRIIKAWDTK